jgi:hypothetical protein
MKTLGALTVVLAAMAFPGTAGAAPGPTPHGGLIGPCNMVAAPGMQVALVHLNQNGDNGMVRAFTVTNAPC